MEFYIPVIWDSLGDRWECFGLLFGWQNWFGMHMSDVWNLVLLCLMWTIWKERNNRIFEDRASSLDQLTGAFVNELLDRSRSLGLTTATIVTVFVDSLCATSFSSPPLKSICPQCAFFMHLEEFFCINTNSYYLYIYIYIKVNIEF